MGGLVALSALGAFVATRSTGAPGAPTATASPFAYDARAPLDLRETGATRSGGVTVHDVSFASPKGGRVPAFLVVPGGRGPFAGLIFQHGLPGTRADMLAQARSFSRLGAVVIAIDAPFDRRGGPEIRFDPRDRADQIQLIVDLRRAVDLLGSRRDVDPRRIAYLGISYGGAMGGLLAGVEHRIAAFVLVVGDGGLLQHFTAHEDAGGTLPPMSARRRRAWIAAMRPIEPLRYVAYHTAPILFQSGRYDDVVPAADARRFQRAAPPPKTVKWYPGGHFLPRPAACDAARWLHARIRIRASHPEC